MDKPKSTRGQSAYLRVPDRSRKDQDRRAGWLVEIDPEGFIPRELEIDANGAPIAVTRPEEYGFWNDSYYGPEPFPPGSDRFRQLWLGELRATPVSADEFETVYQEAIGRYPPKSGCVTSILTLAGLVAAVISN